MTSTTAHPFIDPREVHGLTLAVAPVDANGGARGFLFPLNRVARDLVMAARRRMTLRDAGTGVGLAALAVTAWSTLGLEIAQGTPALAPLAAERVVLPGAKPASNQLPYDYPGIYPGERRVAYHYAPYPSDETVVEEDGEGCLWLKVTSRTEGRLRYPAIDSDGRHTCADPKKAAEPVIARMIGDTLPDVNNATIRIVDVVEPRSGASLLASFIPSQPEDSEPPTQMAVAQFAAQWPARDPVQAPVARTAPVPARVMTSASAQAGSASANMQPAVQAAAQTRALPRQSDNLSYVSSDMTTQPRRRQFVAPQNDVLVPITQGSRIDYTSPAHDELVPISGARQPTPLRAIIPGEPLAPASELPPVHMERGVAMPQGSPLEP